MYLVPIGIGWLVVVKREKPTVVVPVGICQLIVVKKEKPTASRRRLRWLGSIVKVTPHGFCKHLDRIPVLEL